MSHLISGICLLSIFEIIRNAFSFLISLRKSIHVLILVNVPMLFNNMTVTMVGFIRRFSSKEAHDVVVNTGDSENSRSKELIFIIIIN